MSLDLEIGELDRYRLERKIGEGGMGVVYAARQLPLDRPVAIKVIHPYLTASRPDLEERFVREASSLSRISHPSIVTILDCGRTKAGRLYMAMEFVEGKSLADVIAAEGPFSYSRVLRVALRLARALSRAHHAGVIHRDLKPENIMLLTTTEEDDRDQLKVLDFGLAKLFGPGADPDSLSDTGGGPMLGSPRYSSPEQIQGGTIDPRTDVYAVGVILYVMVAGTVPFDGHTPADIVHQHLKIDPPPVHGVGYQRECPPALERVIVRCLQKNQDDRYATMAELIDDIKGAFKSIASSLAEQLPPGLGSALPRLGSMSSTGGLPSFPSSDSNLLVAPPAPSPHLTPLPATPPPLTPPPTTPLPESPSAPLPIPAAVGSTLPGPSMPGASSSGSGIPTTSTSVPAAFVTPLPSYAQPRDQNKTWRVLAVALGLALSAALGALLTLNRSEPAAVRSEPADAPAPPPVVTKPTHAVVRVASKPPGAMVRHRGEEKGRTPTSLRLPMKQGRAVLDFELEGHESSRTEVMLDAESVNVSVELAAQASTRKKRVRRTRRRRSSDPVDRPSPTAAPPPAADVPSDRPTTEDAVVERSEVPVLDDTDEIEVLD